ncbi:MAG: DEAD/DEAH box helicase [Ignavibacteriales bacterium]|nr:DEAD/DEAH box helicase [Ignavibacteriales bacterium]
MQKINSFESIERQNIPESFKGELRDYQKAGVDWFYFLQEFSFGGILADDMGLGKTIEVLAMLAKEKAKENIPPSLIVAPTSVVFNWVNEAARFVPSLKILNHTGIQRIKSDHLHFEDYDIILTSYGILLRDFELFNKQKFHYLILDESQKVKNPASKTARLLKEFNATYRLCMTGTPVENNLNELWSQMAILNYGMLGSLKSFQEVFVNPIQKNNDQESAATLRKAIYPFILRRTKELVAKELPPKTEVTTFCQMEPEQKKLYNIWKEAVRAEVYNEISKKGIKKAGFKIIEGLLRLRQICNHPRLVKKDFLKNSGKFEEFKEMLIEVTKEDHKVLVFSQFVTMLEIMREFLDAEQIPYEYLTGSTMNREERVNNFQTNKEVKVFLISLKAGGFGLNLTAADYVFHYDPWWNPAVEAQATDRTHRIGQDKNVFVYKFITKDSVEEKILQLQEKKRELVRNVISTEAGVLKNLTKEDIGILFD